MIAKTVKSVEKIVYEWRNEIMKKELFSKIKKYMVMCSVAGAMAISGIAGVASQAKAGVKIGGLDLGNIVTYDFEKEGEPNTNNEGFTFRNDKEVGYTRYRYKYNATKVYIYPTVGPTLYYRVHGADSSNGKNVAIRSNPHKVPIGVEASFTNYVWENGNSYARIKVRRTVNAQYVDSLFWWSPDSKNVYKVYD